MKILIKGGGTGKGWSNYVTRKYVNLSKQDREKIVWLKGDSKLGDRIIKSSNYKDNSISLVLAFQGKISLEKARKINEDFEKLFMHGFEKDEYHYEAVFHQDTTLDHIHIRIPTKNLLTDTQLRLYLHKKDKDRINAIRDYLIFKYDLPIVKETKKVVSNEEKKEILINMQRAKQNRPGFDFSKKKGRENAKKYINNYIVELHKNGFLSTFDDIKEVIKNLDLKIEKIGKDFTGDFHYITVSDGTGKKIRLTGELYNEQFWEYSREDRAEQIRTNESLREADRSLNRGLQEAEQDLKRLLRNREQEIKKRYSRARQVAREKREEIVIRNDNNNSDSKLHGRGVIRWFSHEMENGTSSETNAKQSGNYLQIFTKKAIKNDRVRTAIARRAEERERVQYRSRSVYIKQPQEVSEELEVDADRIQDSIDDSHGELRSKFDIYEKRVEKYLDKDRKSIYEQAQEVVRIRRTRRRFRERFREAISEVREQFVELIEKFKYFIREPEHVERKTQRVADIDEDEDEEYSFGVKM